jgi:gamma-glutamyltranspeptidase/glutathione hydrolase
MGLDRAIAPAINAANHGVAAGFDTAYHWRNAANAPPGLGSPPRFGQRYALPNLATTLGLIANYGPDAFYRGPVADAIVAASWLDPEDLASYEPQWVQPLAHTYEGITVYELPAPTQGIAALEALAILGGEEPTVSQQVIAVGLALEDALNCVRDGADVVQLLAPEHIRARRREAPRRVAEPGGGTTYLCVVDGERNAVSLIQSLFESFGSGVVAGSTGVVLQNRGTCFSVGGSVIPGRRPYHTLIPGMLTRGSELVGPFGIMGGFIQAQAHFQFIVELVRNGFDPQAALDHGRFRIDGDAIALEDSLIGHAPELTALGYRISSSSDRAMFGGGQSIICRDASLFGGSDARKDGCALGF